MKCSSIEKIYSQPETIKKGSQLLKQPEPGGKVPDRAELFRDRIDQSEEMSSLFLESWIEAFFVLNANQENSYRARGRDAVPSVGVNCDACRGLFCSGMMTVGAFDSFLTDGQAVASGGETRLLSGPLPEADVFFRVRRRCRADLRGVLHCSRINFISVKVCRSEKNVKQAKTALAVQPGGGRRLFAVHAPVVSRGRAPLMFKYRPGVRSSIVMSGCRPFTFGGFCR